MKKGQVVFVGGGDSFETNEEFYAFLERLAFDPHEAPRQRWRDSAKVAVEAAGHEWVYMDMPNKFNADFAAWKIWFTKIIPFLDETTPTIFIGHSLGASFFVRYISEVHFPKPIQSLHLVATAVDSELLEGGIGNFAPDLSRVSALVTQVPDIHLYHSTDDSIVPYTHSVRLKTVLGDKATFHTFTDRNHFLQPEFPELTERLLKALESR